MDKVKVGVIGCGNISSIYFKNLKQFGMLDVIACADLDMERARGRAEEFGIKHAYTVEQMLADPQIEMVVNLTIPKAHAEISLKALSNGKHVYGEKPLAVTREEGREILKLAEIKGLKVGSAPDTFLGGGIQTCRKLVNDGMIGTPVAATAFMMSRGHEHWHPSPEFYYEQGGGPMFDMGPYYLTALITLLGPIQRLTGSARISYPQRTVTSEPKQGTVIEVKTPTHIAGVLDFAGGAVGTIITSFDIMGGAGLPNIEIYGSEATLRVPDPNRFSGPVMIRYKGSNEWREVPLSHGFTENSRGIGVADMAEAIRTGRMHRANGALAYHVLEAMHGFHDASATGKHYIMESVCTAPAALPAGEEPFL